MWNGSRVVVVVPARDEEARLGRVLATLPPTVDAVVVVDDGSTDGTAEVARRARLRIDGTGGVPVIVLRHPRPRGVGAAIATGYARALAMPGGPRDAFVVMAGDGQMDPRDLPRLVGPVVQGDADYVKGDRFAQPTPDPAMPPLRRAGGRVLSSLTSVAIGQHIADSQCGYTALARATCAALDLESLYPRYGYPNDLLGQLAARRARIVEVAVRAVYAGEASGIGARHIPAILALIARAALRRGRAR